MPGGKVRRPDLGWWDVVNVPGEGGESRASAEVNLLGHDSNKREDKWRGRRVGTASKAGWPFPLEGLIADADALSCGNLGAGVF